MKIIAIVLAAGEGKRMKSKKSKVVHKICGRTMVEWVFKAVLSAGIDKCILVVGHKAEEVKECMGDRVLYVKQQEQLGTGHAVMAASEYFRDGEGYVVVLYGDMPLITAKTIRDAVESHIKSSCSATIITARFKNPAGYGRIIRDEEGNVKKVVEEKDATPEERSITEVNSGIYCFTAKDLIFALDRLGNNNNQREYYLTDTLEILLNNGMRACTVMTEDPDEIMGINDRVQLSGATEILRGRIAGDLMRSGVTIIDPGSTYIDDYVKIGMDTVIYPGTIIEGETEIGEDCTIGPNSRIVNSVIGSNVEFINSMIVRSLVGDNAKIGPFAYIRPESVIGQNVKIGDFVEVKKSKIGDGTKASHLSYIGDAEVGKNVNIGCGVVFVNYDGKKKNKTIVGDNAFIGCNVNLVAPVTVHDNSYIAAGSTITDEVPENALAIARGRQVNKEGWVTRKGLQKK